jgi:hypothetical protein
VKVRKPPEQWSKEDIKTWFSELKYERYADRFESIVDGSGLALLEKEDFIRRCPEAGDVIYGAFHARLGTVEYLLLLYCWRLSHMLILVRPLWFLTVLVDSGEDRSSRLRTLFWPL